MNSASIAGESAVGREDSDSADLPVSKRSLRAKIFDFEKLSRQSNQSILRGSSHGSGMSSILMKEPEIDRKDFDRKNPS